MKLSVRDESWSPSEDRILKGAVAKYGTNQWNRTASLLPNKSAAQCRSRWQNHLSPRVRNLSWEPEDDRRLLELQKRMPNMWQSIATSLGNRSGQQCYARWQYLSRRAEATPDTDEGNEEEEEELDKQLIAEAEARLSNSLGRKALRKRREQQEANRKFLSSIEQHRSKIGSSNAYQLPSTASSLAYKVRQPNRPPLIPAAPKLKERPPRPNEKLSSILRDALAQLPKPTGYTLLDLYKRSQAVGADTDIEKEKRDQLEQLLAERESLFGRIRSGV